MGPESGLADGAAEEISDELMRMHRDSYGQDAANTQVAMHEGFVAVMMDVELSAAERALVRAGHGHMVATTREEYCNAVGAVCKAIIERATGRRVESFTSRVVVEAEPVWSLKVFRFDP